MKTPRNTDNERGRDMEFHGRGEGDQCFMLQSRSFDEANGAQEKNDLFSTGCWRIDHQLDENDDPGGTHFLSQEDLNVFNEVYDPLRDRLFTPPVSSCSSLHPPWKIADSPKKGSTKRLGGQPSKNLMAERRRRKRLNDRLLMLRSIVPKISKMDRTSTVGDTIDYVKELLQKIENLQLQLGSGPNQLSIRDVVRDMKPNEMLVKNSPKFNVERRNDGSTSIKMCCAMNPSLLLSTMNTIESQGLLIQQCVISCFCDFAMQASCSCQQGLDQMAGITAGGIRQALFRNAGYGGKCP